MWLDRFSGQSTPAGATSPSRPYSPSPRKSSYLSPYRSGLNPNANRSSVSLDLSANTSSTSLVSPKKLTNGSSLRYEQKPPPDVLDPLQVLQSLLGVEIEKTKDEPLEDGPAVTEDAESIDFGGLSLEDFVQRDYVPAYESRQETYVGDAKSNRKKYEVFHNSIHESDEILRSVETYLTNFKAELAQVSAEIENLQSRSTLLTTRLENRRKVEKLLGPAVEEITISPYTVRAIAEGPIDDTFVKALNEIESRSILIAARDESSETTKALEDVKPLLQDLKAKAIERIRDYIVSQIKALRSPNINAQVIQQQAFLKYKELYAFLARNHEVLADEISQAYVNTMRWYYASHFARYQQALDKIPLNLFDQSNLIGADPSLAKRNVLNASKSATSQHDAFGIGKRADILKSKNDAALPAYLAEDNKTTQYLETPFRHFNQALIDNICAEYFVVTEFFATSSYLQVAKKLAGIFELVFTQGHNLTKHLTEASSDCLGILICLRISQHLAFELQKRKVPVADSYINYTNILLWPRFQMVMDQHRDSLKKVPTSSTRGTTAAFTLVGGNDPSKTSIAPHAVTQRFGQFLHGILTLSVEAGDEEPIANSLGRLRSEYETLMTKLAKGSGDATKRNKFLYNNYSLVLTIISDTQGKLSEEQKEHFEGLLKDTKTR